MKKEQKRKASKMLTVNHNQNSNKNININISYNLGQVSSPYHRRLHTQNYNPNNSLTSNDPRSITGIKGKKIDNRGVDYVIDQDRLLHNSVESHGRDKAEEAEEECEISIKVVKKKKAGLLAEPNKPSANPKLMKHKTNCSMKNKRRLHTEEAASGPATTTHKNQPLKNFFSTQEQGAIKQNDFNQLAKLYKENRKKSRSGSKEHSESRKGIKVAKRVVEENKEEFEEMIRKWKKNNMSKDSLPKKEMISTNKVKRRNKSELTIPSKVVKQKKPRQKSSEKLVKPKKSSQFIEQRQSLPNRKSLQKQGRPKCISDYRAHYDLAPYILSRLMNRSLLSDSIKMKSQLTSKQISDRKSIQQMQNTILTLDKNSMQLISGVRQMRDFQKLNTNKSHALYLIREQPPSNLPQQPLHHAATTIKQYWLAFQRRKVVQFYSKIFQKNQSVEEEEVSEIVERDGGFEIGSYPGSFLEEHNDSEKKENQPKSKNTFKEYVIEKNRVMAEGEWKGDEEDEQEESRFDIDKYQAEIYKSVHTDPQPSSMIEQTPPPKQPLEQSPSLPLPQPPSSSSQPPPTQKKQQITRFKQQQLQQWNHINRLINEQFNHQSDMDPRLLLQELMKQSELNKRWIEESCEASQRNEQSQPNSRPGSANSQRNQNYRNLIEEVGIADRLKKNSPNIKALLQSQYDIDKSEKSISHRSLDNLQKSSSLNSLPKPSGDSANIDQLMTKQMLEDDQEYLECRDGIFRRKRRQKNELIDQFLDCGLDICGFRESPLGREQERLREEKVEEDGEEEEAGDSMEELRRRSRNVFVNGDRKNSPAQESEKEEKVKEEEQEKIVVESDNDNIIIKINQESRSILISEDHAQSMEEEEYGNNQPISSLFQQQQFSRHGVFQSIYHSILEQFCMQIQIKSKFQRDFNKCFRNRDIRLSRQKGIKTNYTSIKSYLISLVDYLLSSTQQRSQLLKNINSSLGPTSSQMLYYLRLQDYSDYESSEQDEDSVIIISYEAFQRFEIHLDQQQEDNRRNPRLQGYLFGWHRAIIECFNEILDQHRPYGTHGKPYLWEVQPRLKNTVITENTLRRHLEDAAGKVLEIVSFLGGIMFEKEDSPFFGTALLDQHRQQINQDRLSRILATQLFEAEQMWINYNDQKLQIMTQLTSMICQRFMFEAAAEMTKIRRRRALLHN